MQTFHRYYFNTTSFALHPGPRWALSEDVFLQILLQASGSQAAFGLLGQRMVTLLRVGRFGNPLGPMKLAGLRLPSRCSSWLQISRDRASRMTHPPGRPATENLHGHQADLVRGAQPLSKDKADGDVWAHHHPPWCVTLSHLDFERQPWTEIWSQPPSGAHPTTRTLAPASLQDTVLFYFIFNLFLFFGRALRHVGS